MGYDSDHSSIRCVVDTPEPQSHETRRGAHGLGPHVVGRRIVVRHLLPDGRATDVLGTCTRWGADSLTVEPDSPHDQAGPVEIALSDIVTGKPVPPRASVRARASASEVERHVEGLWSHVRTEPLGTWTLRASPPHGGRLRRRGNSVLAMEDPGIGWADAARRVREFYAALDQTPMAQVRPGSEEEARLGAVGFAPTGSGDSCAQLASVAQVARASRVSLGAADDLPARWHGSDTDATVVLGDDVARGRAVLSGDWLLLEGIEVERAHRRRGLATCVLDELVDWGASRGARTAMLHVEVVNEGALALYDRLGFRTHHLNRYLHAPGG